MDNRTALKWTVVYKGAAWLSAVVGFAVALLPVYFWGPNGFELAKLFDAPWLVAPLAVGFVVWQVGKTMAYYKTVAGAVESELAERFDPEIIKSDILSVLDDRLAEVQTELEATRRTVEQDATEADTGGFDFQE